jgi:nucleotide-binding universal stress UspA family protein
VYPLLMKGVVMQKKTLTFEPKNILCPIDFSELSDLALKYAAAGALQFNANLTVFHASHIELPRYITRGIADKISEEINETLKDIQTHMDQHVRSTLGSVAEKLSLNYKFAQSHPVDAILEAAEADQADLIVMGTHGLSGVKRLFMGSVAHGVLESSGIPVFTVRQKEHDFIDVTKTGTVPRIKNILCPCNITAPAGFALRYAVSLSERFHAGITVLHIDEVEESPDFSALKDQVCNWISGSVQTQCEFEPIVLKGNAAEQIIDYAVEKKSDLIVLGAHHRSFHGGTFFGRTTDLVVRRAPLPVLTVPVL